MASGMKTYYVFVLVLAFFRIQVSYSQALKCQNPSNSDYCVREGYNRDQLPPYPPLNVSFLFDVKVRIKKYGIWLLKNTYNKRP